jgi:hypothetical protein
MREKANQVGGFDFARSNSFNLTLTNCPVRAFNSEQNLRLLTGGTLLKRDTKRQRLPL